MKLKDKKIEILAATHTMDAENFPFETLTPTGSPIWVYFRQLSGKKVYTAKSIQTVEEVQFVIIWRNDITTAHVVRYKDTLYGITCVDVFEGYKQDLTEKVQMFIFYNSIEFW